MKKRIALLLAAVMALSSVPLMNLFATSISVTGYDDLPEKTLIPAYGASPMLAPDNYSFEKVGGKDVSYISGGAKFDIDFTENVRSGFGFQLELINAEFLYAKLPGDIAYPDKPETQDPLKGEFATFHLIDADTDGEEGFIPVSEPNSDGLYQHLIYNDGISNVFNIELSEGRMSVELLKDVTSGDRISIPLAVYIERNSDVAISVSYQSYRVIPSNMLKINTISRVPSIFVTAGEIKSGSGIIELDNIKISESTPGLLVNNGSFSLSLPQGFMFANDLSDIDISTVFRNVSGTNDVDFDAYTNKDGTQIYLTLRDFKLPSGAPTSLIIKNLAIKPISGVTLIPNGNILMYLTDIDKWTSWEFDSSSETWNNIEHSGKRIRIGSESVAVARYLYRDFTITNLKVDNAIEPLGVDNPKPTFRWLPVSGGYGKSQSAYRVIVSTERFSVDDEDIVWDSGKVMSENNYDVVYNGKKLLSKTKYYWTVQIWDQDDIMREPYDDSSFETGLMEQTDWNSDAKWIALPANSGTIEMDFSSAQWIWRRDGAAFSAVPKGTQWFRKSFVPNVDKTVSKVYVGMTADDAYELFINGTLIGANTGTDAWRVGYLYDVTEHVRSGKNVLAAWDHNGSTGYAGLLSKIVINYTDGTKDTIVSDNTWKISKTEVNGWKAVDFDDSAWLAPDQAVTYGGAPWGNGVTPTTYSTSAYERAVPMFRKGFTVGDNVKQARIYISGLGMYDLQLNGERVYSDNVLNLGNTQYDVTIPYGVYDVKRMLNNGENVIGVELGNGFWNEVDGVWNWQNAVWRTNPKLRLQLEIVYADGSVQTVVSDETWLATNTGPTTKNSIYYGESYDARKEKTGWASPGYVSDGTWENASLTSVPTGKLKWQYIEPVRKTTTYSPKSITKLANGSYVIRNPEMTTGWMKLTMRDVPAGTQIVITYAETQNANGSANGIYTGWFPKDTIDRDYYIAKGAPVEVFEPRFSYKGYEYIQIDNYPGELTEDDIELYRCSNDVAIVSQLETSNDLINSLHKIMRTTMLNNYQFKPTDTPVWEKNGWTGDANVALPSMFFNFDVSSFLKYFGETLTDGQRADGFIFEIGPTADWTLSQSSIWNSVLINITEQLWDTYGNLSFVEKQYDSMKRLAEYYITRMSASGNTWPNADLGDYIAPMGNPNMGNSADASEGGAISNTVYAYMALGSMERMANALGKTADAARFASYREAVKTAFNNKFYVENGGYYDTGVWNPSGNRTRYRQTSQLLPLAAGLVPEERIQPVLTSLVNDIIAKNYHLDTGFVGGKEILPVLTKYGYADIAYKILNQTTYPSWGYFIARGSTSLWEMWEDATRSRNHYFHGSYDEYLYEYFGGVKNPKDGYKTFELSPLITGDLEYVNLSLDTVRGKLESNWKVITKDSFSYDVTIPFGSEATVYFPTNVINNVKCGDEVVNDSMPGVKSVGIDPENRLVKVVLLSGEYSFTSTIDGYTLDTSKLTGLIKAAKALKQEDYYAKAWADLMALVNEAETLLNDPEALIVDIFDVTARLQEALNDMPNQINIARRDLKKALADIDAMVLNPIAYPKTQWEAFEEVRTRVSEIAISVDSSDELLLTAKSDLDEALDALTENALPNIAFRKSATARTSIVDADANWNIANVTNGVPKNINRYGEYVGYSSTSGNDSKSDHREWIYVDLGSVQEFDYATYYSAIRQPSQKDVGYGFPRRFTIDIAMENPGDESSWITVYDDYKDKDYPVQEFGPLNFYLGKQNARYVRLNALSLNPKVTDNNLYFLQLTQIMLYNRGESIDESDYTVTITNAIVSGCAANIPISIDGDIDGKDIEVVLFGKSITGFNNGYAVASFNADEIPDVSVDTEFKAILKVNGVAASEGLITVKANTADIWKMNIAPNGENTVLSFNESIKPGSRFAVCVNNVVVNIVEVADKSITIGYAAKSGDVFVVKNVKLPSLYPSFSFTFTSTYND